jgi:hypothetical protein
VAFARDMVEMLRNGLHRETPTRFSRPHTGLGCFGHQRQIVPCPDQTPGDRYHGAALFGDGHTMSEKIKMRDGDTMLIMVRGGEVIRFTPNMSLPHSEFVKRTTRELPAGAWVGSVSKLDGEVVAISSKHFFGYQLPAPPEVAEAVRRKFE